MSHPAPACRGEVAAEGLLDVRDGAERDQSELAFGDLGDLHKVIRPYGASVLVEPDAGDLGVDFHCLAQGGGVCRRQAGAVRLGAGSSGLKYPPNVCSTFGTTFSVLIDGLPSASVATSLR